MQTSARGALDHAPIAPPYVTTFYDFTDDTQVATALWTKTVVNSTAATVVNDANGGTVTNTNTGASGDKIQFQYTCEPIQFNQLGKRYLFQYGGKINSATLVDHGFGMAITDTAFLEGAGFATDGVWIEKNSGDALLDLVIAFNATAKADYVREAGFATLDTIGHTYTIEVVTDPVTLGSGVVYVYVDGILKATVETTALPHDEALAPFFGAINGEASASIIVTDFIGWSVPRTPAASL